MTINGKSPAMLYYGAEYCPYCAAERWAMAAALSRFGTWCEPQDHRLVAHRRRRRRPTPSASTAPRFTSPYLTFDGDRAVQQRPGQRHGYTSLAEPDQGRRRRSSPSTARPSTSPDAHQRRRSAFPFVNINNLALISGRQLRPAVLAGQTWTEIAGGLTDPTNPATQAIVATGNYITAAICASTKDSRRRLCCSSPGVQAAAKALKLS